MKKQLRLSSFDKSSDASVMIEVDCENGWEIVEDADGVFATKKGILRYLANSTQFLSSGNKPVFYIDTFKCESASGEFVAGISEEDNVNSFCDVEVD